MYYTILYTVYIYCILPGASLQGNQSPHRMNKKRPCAGNVGGCCFADLKIYADKYIYLSVHIVCAYVFIFIYTNNLQYNADIMFRQTWKRLPIAIDTMYKIRS